MNQPQDHNGEIGAHFDGIADNYPKLKARNRYYHEYLLRWCRAILPPGRKVVDFGCGRGDMLAGVVEVGPPGPVTTRVTS